MKTMESAGNWFRRHAGFWVSVMTMGIAVAPAFAWAAFPPPTGISSLPTPPLQKTTDIENLAKSVILWVFWGLIILSVIMFIVGAYRYATSGGEPEKVSSANKTLLYAAIAVAVAIIAAGVPLIVGSFLGYNLSPIP